MTKNSIQNSISAIFIFKKISIYFYGHNLLKIRYFLCPPFISLFFLIKNILILYYHKNKLSACAIYTMPFSLGIFFIINDKIGGISLCFISSLLRRVYDVVIRDNLIRSGRLIIELFSFGMVTHCSYR